MPRGVYRAVFSVLFDDLDYRALRPAARLTLLTLRQCREAGPGAIFELSRDTLARRTGLSAGETTRSLRDLIAGGWIELEGDLVWVRNGLRFDPIMTTSNPNHVLAIEHSVALLPRQQIVLKFCEYYQIKYPYPIPSPHPIPNGLPPSHTRSGSTDDRGLRTEEGELPCRADDARPPTPSPAHAVSRKADVAELIAFLNAKTGRSYRPIGANARMVAACLMSGATVQQCKGVIARKCRQWLPDPKMAPYLRPATLFNATKFEQYLGEREGAADGEPVPGV